MFRNALLTSVILVKAVLLLTLGVQPAAAGEDTSSAVLSDDAKYWPFPDDDPGDS